MDPDGLIYASISQHQSTGVGTFWFPYSMFNEAAFHHHPPLMFGLQSIFFRLFGDSFVVENLYHLVILLSLSWVLLKLDDGPTGWFTLLLLFLMPIVAFGFTDNLLEPTLTLFTCAAVLCLLQGTLRGTVSSALTGSLSGALPAESSRHTRIGLLTLAALLTTAAFLTKGPVGLFPLATLPLAAVIQPEFRTRLAKSFGFYIGMLVLLSLLLACIPPARESITAYFDYQLKGTFAGERPMVHGRAYLLEQWLKNLGGPALVVGIIFFSSKIRSSLRRTDWLWLAIALSASVPLLISPRQFAWYLIPALPFYALFLAGIVRAAVSKVILPTGIAIAISAALLLLLSVNAYRAFGSWDNDFEEAQDLAVLQGVIARDSIVGSCVPTDQIYRLFLYLSRHHGVKIEGFDRQQWVLCTNLPAKGYQRVDVDLNILPLYQRL